MTSTKPRPNNDPPRSVRTTGPGGEEIERPETGTNPQPRVERIGDILRKERERRGDDLHRIADHICIKASYLAALEDNDYDAFPADAYVIGFLRSYAVYLGFDGKEAIDAYRHEMEGRRRKPALAMPAGVQEGRTPSAAVIAGAVIAGLLIYALWYGLSSSDRTAVSQPPALPSTTAPTHADTTPSYSPPQETSPVSTPASETPPAAAPEPPQAQTPAPVSTPVPTPAPVVAMSPAPATPPAAPAHETAPTPAPVKEEAKQPPAPPPPAPPPAHLQIRALTPSWILITNNKGDTVVDRVMKAGEVYKVPDQKGLALTTGNGSGIVLIMDGRDLPKLSNDSANVLRDIPLDTSHLKALPQSGD